MGCLAEVMSRGSMAGGAPTESGMARCPQQSREQMACRERSGSKMKLVITSFPFA